ncbi:MAG: hypothetical protein ACE5R6_21220 [Candidatus Heimdallarchaeota archaeon]
MSESKMINDVSDENRRIPLGRDELIRVRTRALRRGVWFSALTKGERAMMDLTIRVVERVRSHLLAKVLTSVVKKLMDAMEGGVARLMRTVGRSLARRLSGIARAWGNKSAVRWAEEPGFIQYLSIMHMNTPAAFKVWGGL